MPMGPAPAEFNQCSLAGCKRPIHARGLCHPHYMKQHRSGAIGPSGAESLVVRIRFYATEEIERGLKRLSRITGQATSQVLRSIVEQALKEKKVL